MTEVDRESFHERFASGSESFHAHNDSETDIVKTHISTMTFTSRLTECRDLSYLFEYLTSLRLDRDLQERQGLLTIPRIEKSRFSKYAVDIVPFNGMLDKVRVRVFCTTGSILVTGCVSHIQCLAALEELTRLIECPLFPHITCAVPECRLINANCSLGYTLNIPKVVELFKEERSIRLVELPERHAVTIIHFNDGTKVMTYSSGKFSIHGNSFEALNAARTTCIPVFRKSQGLQL